jgi:hypothetical protein
MLLLRSSRCKLDMHSTYVYLVVNVSWIRPYRLYVCVYLVVNVSWIRPTVPGTRVRYPRQRSEIGSHLIRKAGRED